MGIKIAIIFAIHAFAFLVSNSIFSFKDTLVQKFLLNGQIHVQSMFSEATVDISMLLLHFRNMFLLFALLAFAVTTLYYLSFESKSGGTSSRRGLWNAGFACLLFLAVAGSLMAFKLPFPPKGLGWVVTPLTLWVTVIPYYISTVILCHYDAPLSFFFKNALAGKSN